MWELGDAFYELDKAFGQGHFEGEEEHMGVPYTCPNCGHDLDCEALDGGCGEEGDLYTCECGFVDEVWYD